MTSWPHSCFICGYSTQFSENMREHRSTHAVSFACEFCGDLFPNNELRVNHIETEHNYSFEERSSQCSGSSMSDSNVSSQRSGSDLSNSPSNVSGSSSSSVSGSSSSSSSSQTSGSSSSTSSSQESDSSYSNSTSSPLQSSTKSSQPQESAGRSSCSTPSYVFPENVIELNKEWPPMCVSSTTENQVEMTSVEEDTSSPIQTEENTEDPLEKWMGQRLTTRPAFLCKHCGKKFTQKFCMKRHVMKEHNGRIETSIHNLNQTGGGEKSPCTNSSHSNPLPSPSLSNHPSPNSPSSHSPISSPNRTQGKKWFRCTKCNFSTQLLGLYSHHLREMNHGVSSSPASPSSSPMRNNSEEAPCASPIPSQSCSRGNIAEETPFISNSASLTPPNIINLSNSTSTNKQREKIFTCKECNFKSTRLSLFVRHTNETNHGVSLPSIAHDPFSSPKSNSKSNHNPKPKPNSTKIKSFPKSTSKSVQNLHQCGECDYVSNRAGNLKQHISAVHNKASKPPTEFKCPSCDKKFGYMRNLTKHYSLKHDIDSWKPKLVENGAVILISNTVSSPPPSKKKKTNATLENENENDLSDTSPIKPKKKKKSQSENERNRELRIARTAERVSNFLASRSDVHALDPNNLFVESAQAHEGFVQTFSINVNVNDPGHADFRDPLDFLNANRENFHDLIKHLLSRFGPFRYNLMLKVRFYKDVGDDNIVYEPGYFWSHSEIISNIYEIDDTLNAAFAHIMESIATYCDNGSGWVIDHVEKLDFHKGNFMPLAGGGSDVLSKLNKRQKGQIINLQSTKNECFKLAVVAALKSKTDPVSAENINIITSEFDTLNWDGITLPVSLNQITKFENLNQDVSVNVYGFECYLFPLRITKVRERSKHINLLLVENEEGNHFCAIKNLRPFAVRGNKNSRHICEYCLHTFKKQENLINHVELCRNFTPQRITIPKKGTILKFSKFHKQLLGPYIAFADFETMLPLIHTVPGLNQNTHLKHLHVPISFCLIIVDSVTNKIVFKYTYIKEKDSDKCPATVFLEVLMKEATKICQEVASKHFKINWSQSQKDAYAKSNRCHICEQTISHPKREKVADHDHRKKFFNFRGAAHKSCNVNYNNKNFILPLFIHNSSNFDNHIIIQALNEKIVKNVEIIPKSMEKFTAIRLDNKVIILDSYQFLSESLDNLVKSLPSEKFNILKQVFPNPEHQSLLQRKGVYPYEEVDSLAKLKLNSLPPQNKFYSSLTKESVSDEDYTHAKNVWEKFECKRFFDYLKLYQESDVCLLADVFQNFRRVCMKTYKLDPAKFISLPGFAWEVALRKSRVELELLSDIDMILFYQSAIRGGISQISKRYAKANFPDLGKSYNKNLPNSYIMYLDAVNLYGYAQNAPLPTKNFEWLKPEEVKSCFKKLKNNPDSLKDDTDTGYFFEVDLEYPSHLHNLHNSYPLAPEHLKITEDLLSVTTVEKMTSLNLKNSPTNKLVPNLRDKFNYILHSQNLKLYLSLGLILKKIHRGIKFTQEKWLAEYINTNTELRKNAKDECDKKLFKLLNNSVFGKSVEDVRKYSVIKVLLNKADCVRTLSRPNVKRFKIVNENVVLVEMIKENVKMNKPIYGGASILDLSKVIMYNFHYNYILPKFKEERSPEGVIIRNQELLFTDTDSLCYQITTEDVYKDLNPDIKEWFDTSEYPTDHENYYEGNKKVLGKFTDETKGVPILEYVGLQPKMYTFRYGNLIKKTAKGVSYACQKHEISFEHYLNCLFKNQLEYRSISYLRSINHVIYTINNKKLCLSPLDTKRWLLPNGIDTLAIGHVDISQEVNEHD